MTDNETAEEAAARQAAEAMLAAELAASDTKGANLEHKPDGDDLLNALEAEPAPAEAETCGVQYVDKIRAYPERCQLPKDHPPSPGHRHGNIGWWR